MGVSGGRIDLTAGCAKRDDVLRVLDPFVVGRYQYPYSVAVAAEKVCDIGPELPSLPE